MTLDPPPDDCSNSYTFDFEASVASGRDPGLSAGTVVNGQFWSRDPASPGTTGLTSGLEFSIRP